MNCQQLQLNCGEILDGDSDPTQEYALLQHLKHCHACTTHLQHHMQLKRLLRQLHAPPADPNLAQRIINQRHENSFHLSAWLQRHAASSMMLAASLALFIFSALLPWTPPDAPSGNNAVVSATLDRKQTLNLVLHSAAELDQVTFAVITPHDLPLQGGREKHYLQWTGQLKKGDNLMSLPIQATGNGTGKLIMEIRHNGASKQFVVQINHDGDNNV